MMKFLVVIVFFALCMCISWGLTVAVVKLITLCFGLEFSLSIATGIWLIECLVHWFIKGLSPSKKKGA